MLARRLVILTLATSLLFCTIALAEASLRWTDFKVEPVIKPVPAVIVEPAPAPATDLTVNFRMVGTRRLREIVRQVTPEATKVVQASYQP